MGDTGGDHDLYDYCIDDPVTMNDPAGLIAPLLVMGGVLAAKALGLGVGLGGMYVAGKATDAANKSAGRKAPSAAKAVEEVAGKTTAMSLGSGLAGTAIVTSPMAVARGGQALVRGVPRVINATRKIGSTASETITNTAQKADIALRSSRLGEKAIQTAEFAENFANPNPPVAVSSAAYAGSSIGRIFTELRDFLKQNKPKKDESKSPNRKGRE